MSPHGNTLGNAMVPLTSMLRLTAMPWRETGSLRPAQMTDSPSRSVCAWYSPSYTSATWSPSPSSVQWPSEAISTVSVARR